MQRTPFILCKGQTTIMLLLLGLTTILMLASCGDASTVSPTSRSTSPPLATLTPPSQATGTPGSTTTPPPTTSPGPTTNPTLDNGTTATPPDGNGSTETPSTGLLTGQVRIGPLCPVEPCQEPTPDVYSSRHLVLESGGGERVEVALDSDGRFEKEVEVGTYVVNLTDCDYLGCSAALPAEVTIVAGETTMLEIDIDTGIR